MTHPLLIVRRQSPNWGSMTQDEFRAQSRKFCIMAGLPAEQVNMTVDLWDKTFRRSYCSVRQALKDLALENLRSIQGSDLITMDVLTEAAVVDSHYYLFIDDDDWLCPDIASYLPVTTDETCDGIVWGSVAFGTHKKQAIQARAIDGFCYTNNYAVVGRALRDGLLSGRSPAQHWDAESLLKGRSRIIDQYLSVTNKSPSSTCYLMHVLQGDYSDGRRLETAIEEYLDRCQQYRTQLPPTMHWAVMLIEKTLDIFKAL